MAQLQKGTTYTTGSTVTASNLNAHVDSAVLLDGAVSSQTALSASPASDDAVLISDTDAVALKKVTTTELLGTELAAWVGKGASGGTAALQIDGVDKLSVDSSGDTTVAGATTMTGAVTASSTLAVTGVTTLSDHLNLLTNKEARFQDAADNEYVGVKAPATVSASSTLTLPDAVGASGEVLQASDGSGSLEWAAQSSPFTNVSTFTSTGTWTCPSGVTKVWVYAVGAGGAGASNNPSNSGGGGGGAGAFAKELCSVTASTVYDVSIGSGGTAPSYYPGGSGNAGGNTTFTPQGGSVLVTANGGGGGTSASPWTGGSGGSAPSTSFGRKGDDGATGVAGTYGRDTFDMMAGGGGSGASAGTGNGNPGSDGKVVLVY